MNTQHRIYNINIEQTINLHLKRATNTRLVMLSHLSFCLKNLFMFNFDP